MSEDPIFWNLNGTLLKDPQQQNSYSYSRGNPITMKDPSGKCLEDLCVGEVMLAGMLLSTYAPQISSFAQGLLTPLGQYSLGEAHTDLKNGHYLVGVAGVLTSGEIPEGVIQHTIPWSSTRKLSSEANLLGHFADHKSELKALGINSPQEMYDEANNVVKGVDNKNIFQLADTSGKESRALNFYDKSRNLLVGMNTKGEISTMHVLTDPKKFSLIESQVQNIISSFKNIK